MYDQWIKKGSPKPPFPFDWVPVNPCPVTNDFRIAEFKFYPLIWSKYSWGIENRNEPFGCLVTHKNGLYLVFRGSKSLADFDVDDEKNLVSYDPPTPNPPSGVQVEQGWHKVYTGLLDELRAQLQATGGTLIITGHSLGSALATLAVPEAVAHGLAVHHYNSASPMVGPESFRAYYRSLTTSSPGYVKETFRLVNTADTVPTFPSTLKSPAYVHVGIEVPFNADYGDEQSIHNPCCSYAYAVYHPEQPCNPTFDNCNVPPN
jgi:hypothetical protein